MSPPYNHDNPEVYPECPSEFSIKMAEEAQARVQQAVNKLVEELDKSSLRKMQGDMHRCAAACCDQQVSTLEQVHTCIESCSASVASSQTFIQSELNNFQDRLQRCVLQCQDSIRDQILPSTTEGEVKAYRDDYERCVVKCADTHIDLMPGLLKRMQKTIASTKNEKIGS